MIAICRRGFCLCRRGAGPPAPSAHGQTQRAKAASKMQMPRAAKRWRVGPTWVIHFARQAQRFDAVAQRHGRVE